MKADGNVVVTILGGPIVAVMTRVSRALVMTIARHVLVKIGDLSRK